MELLFRNLFAIYWILNYN